MHINHFFQNEVLIFYIPIPVPIGMKIQYHSPSQLQMVHALHSLLTIELLHIHDLILILYIFKPFFYIHELFPLRQPNWFRVYQDQG